MADGARPAKKAWVLSFLVISSDSKTYNFSACARQTIAEIIEVYGI